MLLHYDRPLGELYSLVVLQTKQNISFPTSPIYLTIVHRDHLLNIEYEGSSLVVPFFPLAVTIMEAFYTVGYILDSFLERSIWRDTCSQFRAFQPYVTNS